MPPNLITRREKNAPTVAVIGGGPAGLMAAEVLSEAGVDVAVYDAMPSVGRKLLMAGKSGLNLTHAQAWDVFLSRYAPHEEILTPFLNAFTANDVRNWALGLGIETFVGSSGKVFPVAMKASPLLRAWLARLRSRGTHFYTRHRWVGFDAQGYLRFVCAQGEKRIEADAVIFALGGASWPRLGSTGAWTTYFAQRGIFVSSLKPANCGFDVAFSTFFVERFSGQPLKSIRVTFDDGQGRIFDEMGELVITHTGIEGSLIYQLSARLREAIFQQRKAVILLDLMPHYTAAQLLEKLQLHRAKRSLTTHLKKQLGITGVKVGLLYETLSKAELESNEKICHALKALPLTLMSPRPIDEAISTAGGVCLSELDEKLMLRRLPGVFCAGEMLDWEAPTGGYLLTACLAMGRWAGFGVLDWLKTQGKVAQ